MELAQRIEAILFWKGEPVEVSALSKMLDATPEEVSTALTALSETLTSRGIRVVTNSAEVSLMTAPEMTEAIDALRKDEMKRDIGKAGAETLAIVLYRGPIGRSEIDYIRGVNSSFILRNLMMRGLVERIDNPRDKRAFAYGVTTDLLAHLGVSSKEELPEYASVMSSLEAFLVERDAEEAKEPTTISP